MNKRRPDIPILIVGFIFIAAGVYAFVVDELILYSKYVGASKGYRFGGYPKEVIAFLLLAAGSLLMWTKGRL